MRNGSGGWEGAKERARAPKRLAGAALCRTHPGQQRRVLQLLQLVHRPLLAGHRRLEAVEPRAALLARRGRHQQLQAAAAAERRRHWSCQGRRCCSLHLSLLLLVRAALLLRAESAAHPACSAPLRAATQYGRAGLPHRQPHLQSCQDRQAGRRGGRWPEGCDRPLDAKSTL